MEQTELLAVDGNHPASGRIRKQVRNASDWVTENWLKVVGLFSISVFFALFAWQSRFPLADGEAPQKCWYQSFSEVGAPQSCIDALVRIVKSLERQGVPISDSVTGTKTSRWVFEEPGWPRLFVWTDNFFVDLYTLVFLGVCLSSYFRLNVSDSESSAVKKWLLAATVGSCLSGAIADHIENFWLLAHIGSGKHYADELMLMASVSAWKFRLFGLNALIALGWAAYARRMTQPKSAAGP